MLFLQNFTHAGGGESNSSIQNIPSTTPSGGAKAATHGTHESLVSNVLDRSMFWRVFKQALRSFWTITQPIRTGFSWNKRLN